MSHFAFDGAAEGGSAIIPALPDSTDAWLVKPARGSDGFKMIYPPIGL